MTIEKEEPGLYVAYCDDCGERRELDTPIDAGVEDAIEEIEELGWSAAPLETIRYPNERGSSTKVVYAEHSCPDCR